MLTACRLGLADLRHERLMAVCQGLALAAVLAPLLILYGLKYGIVSGTLQALREQPANREILVLGNNRLTADDLAALRALPEVGFLVPKPRSFARTLYLERASGTPRGLFEADLIPSAAGDPLLPERLPALAADAIALAPQLATRMQLRVGDRVQGSAVRGEVRGNPEKLSLTFTVAHILPEGRIGGRSALLEYPTLDRIEAFTRRLRLARARARRQACGRAPGRGREPAPLRAHDRGRARAQRSAAGGAVRSRRAHRESTGSRTSRRSIAICARCSPGSC